MQTLSLIWGILAALGLFVAFFPCLGSLNWLNIPFSFAGLIVSIIAVATAREGSRGAGTAGLILCALAVVLGVARLMMGGGIL